MSKSGDEGVIFFSMGASLDASVAPPELLSSLLQAFSRLHQRVLMKIGGVLPKHFKVPPNVRIQRWVPQQDILGNLFLVCERII
jgi:ceramide galactosyltransferase